MSRAPFRPQVLAPMAWVGAGGCWVVQLTLPWTSDATLSRSSFADVLTLVRGGHVEEAVSSWVAVLALVLPVVGVVLAGLAGLRGRLAHGMRALLALLGTGALVVATRTVPQDDAGLGEGGRVALVGCVVALVALGLDVVAWLRRVAAPDAAPRRTTSGTILAVAALALALVGAGHVGWQATRHPGGADSPEAAVRALVAALVERDAVAVLVTTAPDEVERVVGTFVDLRGRMGGQGNEEGDGGAGVTDAVSLDVSDVVLEVEAQDVDRARVTLVDGGYEIDLDLEVLPGPFAALGSLFPDGGWTGGLADLTDSPAAVFLGDVGEQLSISTVRVDGRWYVTGLGTALDHVSGVLLGDELATPDLADLPDALLDRLLPS